jgi:hypothetical protein
MEREMSQGKSLNLALSVLLASIAASATAQTMNTWEHKAAQSDAQIFALARQSGLVLTKEAVATVRASAQISDSEFRAVLDRLPVIHLIVSPVPPRDYSVTINGTHYEATEESKYGVRPGPVELIVERGAIKPCLHKLVVHQDQTIRCDM